MSWLSKVVCCSVLLVGCAEDGALGPPGDSDLTGTATGTLYPCDVANVLATRCFTCHGSTPVGTPMSLASQSVMFETSQTRAGSGQLIGQLVFDRINSPNSPMPPRNAPSGALTDGERALLNDWLDKGAQKAGAEAMSCQPTPPPGAGGTFTGGAGGAPFTPGSGGTTPVPGGGGTVTSAGGAGVSSGGAGIAPPDGGEPIPVEDMPVPPEPGECNVVKIRARTAGAAAAGVTEGAPYQVPSNYIDKYICFEFDLNLPGPTQALQFKSAVEGPWVHHWLLYRKRPGLAASNGANSECLGVHPDAELLAGWAPGAGDWNLPKHVGMDMGQGKYVLELHYNNLGAPTGDSSGVDVCLTQNLRPQTAGIHWLGSEFLTLAPQQAKDEVSMCRPANQTEPIHALRWWPHMHLMGRSMRAEIHRADGTKEAVFDEPFDFNNQIQYDIPRVVNPGDSILTTCRFMNTSPNLILFGERTTEEMCYNFVVAYPASSLVSFPQGIHSNSCQGPP